MTPEQTFNHHMKEVIKALRRCQPAYIGKAYAGVDKAVKTVMFREAAKMWKTGAAECDVDRAFNHAQIVQKARMAIGPNKVPYRVGLKAGHRQNVESYLVALKKPGDTLIMPVTHSMGPSNVTSWCGTRGIRVSIKAKRHGQPDGMIMVTCTRHVPYEESERKAKLATSQTVSSDMASSHDQAIQA